MKCAISSGHGKYVRGASGIIDEVDEARKVVERIAEELEKREGSCVVWHDNQSKSQSENLQRIVDWHNSQDRDVDISCHFNAYEQVEKPMGTEVLYLTQQSLAATLSEAISSVGFINRGAKKRTDLKFLNATSKPAVLLEICFVDSETDCEIYDQMFDEVCDNIADVLGGVELIESTEPPPPGTEVIAGRVDIVVSGDVVITINGVEVER